MNKTDLIAAVAEKAGLAKTDAKKLLKLLFLLYRKNWQKVRK